MIDRFHVDDFPAILPQFLQGPRAGHELLHAHVEREWRHEG